MGELSYVIAQFTRAGVEKEALQEPLIDFAQRRPKA